MTKETPDSSKKEELKITVRLAQSSDIRPYTDLLQYTYEAAYASEEHGLPKELFSKEIFSTADTQRYLLSNLEQNENQRTWLAFRGEQLVGSITAAVKGNDCEFRGFYVTPRFQGKGIGKQLAELANQFAGNRDIILDTYTHNTKTLAMYRALGFEDDGLEPIFYRHWPEWPEGAKAESIRLRLRRSKEKAQ